MVKKQFEDVETLSYQATVLHLPLKSAFKILGFRFQFKFYTQFLSNGTDQETGLVASELFWLSVRCSLCHLYSQTLFNSLFHLCMVLLCLTSSCSFYVL